jgi:hypothetical protein
MKRENAKTEKGIKKKRDFISLSSFLISIFGKKA